MVLLWNVSPPQNLRHCKQDRGLRWTTRGGAFSRRWSSEANRANVAACEGLCGALAEGAASGDTKEAAGRVGPVWAEIGTGVLRGYLQRENSMGSGTAAAVLWVKSGGFGQPKKVLDKGRWSLATTSRSQAPQCGAFRDSGTDVGFRDFQNQGGRSGKKFSVSKQLRRVGLVPIFFLSETKDIASLYQRKEPGKIAAQGVLNKLIIPPFDPGYFPRVRVLCVAE